MTALLGPRALVFLIAAATPAVAFRLGGISLWTAYAAGLTVAAAIAAFVLWQDELLFDVLARRGFDLLVGFLASAAMYALVWAAFNLVVAPAGEAGGLLRKCTATGVRLPRLDAHGFTAALEWVRAQTCKGYAQSLGVFGAWRAVLIVVIAALEELAWRGGVQQSLSEKLGSTRGWLAAAGLYALAQAGTGSWLLVPLALLGGLVWGGLYRYRGRLVPAIFSHIVFSYFLFHERPLVDFR